MIRAVYRALVWMHPPAFRREFSGEMLWIYDEGGASLGVVPLLLDGVVSLGRQWFLRSGSWKYGAGMLAALLQATFWSAVVSHIGHSHKTLRAVEDPELAAVMRIGAVTAVGLFAAVICLVFWWRRLVRRTGV